MRRALVLAALLLAGRVDAQPANGWQPLGNGWSELRSSPATGTVTTTGTLASGQVALGSGATSITGDAGCTWSGTGVSFLLSPYALTTTGRVTAGTDVFIGGQVVMSGFAAASTGTPWRSIASGYNDNASDAFFATAFLLGDGSGLNVRVAVTSPADGRLLVEDVSGVGGAVLARAHLFVDDAGTGVLAAITGPGNAGVTTLTESSATSFATLTYGAAEAVSAEFLVRVKANDATNFQGYTGRFQVSSVRKATGNTVSAVGTVSSTLAESAGGSTLTCSFTVVEGASAATVQASCASSLTQTTLNISFVAETVGPATVAQL